MKFVVAATALGMALVASAQDITSLPQCAQQPILVAISSSGCPLTNIKCICGNEAFVAGLLKEIPTVCNPAEVAVTTVFSEELCAGYGVTLSLTVSSATPTASLVSSTAPASTTSSASSTVAGINATVSTSSPSSTGATTGGSISSSATTGAAPTQSASVAAGLTKVDSALTGFLVMAGLGAFMLV